MGLPSWNWLDSGLVLGSAAAAPEAAGVCSIAVVGSQWASLATMVSLMTCPNGMVESRNLATHSDLSSPSRACNQVKRWLAGSWPAVRFALKK